MCISAHYVLNSSTITNSSNPEIIYDFYGFPEELYRVKYPAKSSNELVEMIKDLNIDTKIDSNRGFDHGAWCVLKFLYPNTDIPICQLSINSNFTTKDSYEFGKKLKSLRENGVLIVGSGNIVHNLALCDFSKKDVGFDWAIDFDKRVKDLILNKDHESIINYHNLKEFTGREFYTREHFEPLIYTLGASNDSDDIEVFNESYDLGAISMTSYLFT